MRAEVQLGLVEDDPPIGVVVVEAAETHAQSRGDARMHGARPRARVQHAEDDLADDVLGQRLDPGTRPDASFANWATRSRLLGVELGEPFPQ